MALLHLFALLLLSCGLASTAGPYLSCRNQSRSLSFTLKTQVRPVATFTSSTPHYSFFGAAAVTPAPTPALIPGVHPRIVFDQAGWDAILDIYADDTHFDRFGSWSRFHRYFTLDKGPHSSHLVAMALLETSSAADAYDPSIDYTSATLTTAQKNALGTLAGNILKANELQSQAFFMCALWAKVQDLRVSRGFPSFLTTNTQTCIDATVAWAKVLLAHRAFHCAGSCPGAAAPGRIYLWNYNARFQVSSEWYTAGFTIALTYDVLYHEFTDEQRRIIRSAIAMLVLKKASWGNTETSTTTSPNAEMHPHRIFSNWAPYHSNLYLTNLAIEGETDYDAYTTAVLQSELSDPSSGTIPASEVMGFNEGLDRRFQIMLEAYMAHSFYQDGTTFEDGYTYFIALREGSLGLIAAQRRGSPLLDSDRFRNTIHNVAQMLEPWHCGRIIGHASGGGEGYQAWAGLLRYVYPNGILSNMVWRQRMGDFFKNGNPCRIQWHQTMMQLSITGAEHGSVTSAESPGTLETASQPRFPLSFYGPRRGLLIARTGLSENSCYIHFDARPDAFFPGHDNADRGVFTFSAFHQTWIEDLQDWRNNVDSRMHSLMHVDGLAQDEKAPSVRMMKTEDDGEVVLAAANLTYAYNIQWARNWPAAFAPYREVNVYSASGTLSKVWTLFPNEEIGDPRDFGWPAGDDGADLGFTRPESNLYGDPDIGFRGMYTWKRNYRTEFLEHAIRSIALVRVPGEVGYFLLTDSFLSTDESSHTFESYLMLHDSVSVEESSSSCSDFSCKIVLKNGRRAQVDIHVLANALLEYRVEEFTTERTHRRLIVKGIGGAGVDMFMGFHAHESMPNNFIMKKEGSGLLKVTYGSDARYFEIDPMHRDLVIAQASPTPSTSPSATQTSTPTPIPSQSSSSSPMASSTTTATATPSMSATPSTTATATSTATATPSPSFTGSTGTTPPMPAIRLPSRSPVRLRSGSFTADRSTFFSDTGFLHQIVFSFKSVSPRRGPNGDRISTCAHFTKAVTEISVYECTSYEKRECTLLRTAANDCGRRSDFRMKLVKGQTYYAVLSVNPGARGNLNVLIRHIRGRV